MICPNCGSSYDGDVAFCPQCGTPQNRGGNTAQQNDDAFSQATFSQNTYEQNTNTQQNTYGQPGGYQQNTYNAGGYQQNTYSQAGGYQQNTYNAGGYQQNTYSQPGGYQQNPYGGAYGGGGFRAPIQQRNIVVCIILSIVTCGIYGIVWFINMVNDLNTACGTPEDTSGGMVFLLSIVTCGIYLIYWYYKAGEKVSMLRRRSGVAADSSSGVLYLVLALFGLSIVDWCLIQSELNRVASV